MNKKYNIALLPVNQSNKIVTCAEEFFDISNTYMLSKNSLPHVTILQLNSNENEIFQLWNNVCINLSLKEVQLTFNTYSYISFDNEIFWISLMPSEIDLLFYIHEQITTIIDKPINTSFDPHMTLINTYNRQASRLADSIILKNYIPFSDNFVLTIGECDSIGQYTKLIYQ